MSQLKNILEDLNRGALDAGGVLSTKVLKRLNEHRKRQLVVFVCIELIVIIAVVFCAYYLTQYPQADTIVKVLCGVLGIGAGGGIEVMRRVWKEWSRTDLLLTLLADASEPQVQAVIDKLIRAL